MLCNENLPTENKFLFHSKSSRRLCDLFSYGNDPLAIAYNATKIQRWEDCKCPLFKSVFEDMATTTSELEQMGYFKFNATSILNELQSLHISHPFRRVESRFVNIKFLPNVHKFVHNLLTPRVQSYIGEHMVRGTSTLLKLSGRNLMKSEYVSGMWHHDRCAKRVKCFMFLTDIDETAHPMRLISNSHKQIYFDYSNFPLSRLTYEYALKHGKEVVFTGPAGHGFCFDTNGIHRGTLSGRKQRVTLITEFHSQSMKDTYARLNVQAPFGK